MIRPAEPVDVPVLFDLIKALAEYEKLSHAVTGNAEALLEHLFGSNPYIEAVIAEYAGETAGFALFFNNYSTLLTQPGIYLEDLFVLPEYRSQGIGKALLSYLGNLAVKRFFGRLEWSVLDWNESAIAFYRRMGASVLEHRRICRVTGESLIRLANQVTPPLILRSCLPDDVPVLFHLIQAKAGFDKQAKQFNGNTEALEEHLFSSPPYTEATLAEYAGQIVGFAQFSTNYSTFLTQSGIYLEDLFVLPEFRSQGIGKALLSYVAQLAVERGCGRLEWTVAVWNQEAIAFYRRMGASILEDWRLCRVTGESLMQLAAKAS